MFEMNLKVLLGVMTAALLFGLATTGFASGGMTGDCVDCHTMHNSENGQPVAVMGTADTTTYTPIENLLRMDCIACHAANPAGADKIVELTGGSQIPQVMHSGTEGDLAGGNFQYIVTGGSRKGHNVVDLVPEEADMIAPPGFRHIDGPEEREFDVTRFTCAGSMGCHGFRGQILTPAIDADPFAVPPIPFTPAVFRTGMSALSGYEGAGNLVGGAHHNSYDGVKLGPGDPNFADNPLATSYRFIRGLRGYGNEDDRWQNVDKDSHNEYFGYSDPSGVDYYGAAECGYCHKDGQGGPFTRLNTPNQTITSFCVTCHTMFHSSGTQNGTSGAFLRHPSDWVIPAEGEYLGYTEYNVTAPVGRMVSTLQPGMTPSPTVTPGDDQVICLSCHVAHASPYDSMLRFDYSLQTAGIAQATTTVDNGDGTFTTTPGGLGQGCLACHTSKGILPGDR